MPASTLVESPAAQPKHSKVPLNLDLSITAKSPKSSSRNVVEKIDLANEEDSTLPSKKMPRHMQGLEKLHQSVIKGALTPVVSQRKPLRDFSKSGQLQLSFLNSDDAKSSIPKQSIEYSDESLNDLPSPSELLKISKRGLVEEQVADSFEESHTASRDLVDEKEYDTNILEEFDLSQFDNDQCDIEAAMVGLSDSITMQERSLSQSKDANPGLSNIMTPLKSKASESLFPIASASINLIAVSQPDKKIFSIDSPTKILITNPEKRSAEGLLEEEHSDGVTLGSKRQKLDNGPPAQAVLKPACLDPQLAAPPSPIVKPGQPAWVYEFDPAFIAEYQDIVEFI